MISESSACNEPDEAAWVVVSLWDSGEREVTKTTGQYAISYNHINLTHHAQANTLVAILILRQHYPPRGRRVQYISHAALSSQR